ncbi:hypothetical protein [Bailinhaonella thermotolerans]|nr:hypothetical protein [Bailinhaonella thermotolerans]
MTASQDAVLPRTGAEPRGRLGPPEGRCAVRHEADWTGLDGAGL